MTAAPFQSHWLYRDQWLGVAAVRCPTDPPQVGPLEVATSLEVAFPLRGTYVRHGRGDSSPVIADAATAVVTRAGEAYRVAHPVGGADRSAAIVLAPGASGAGSDPGRRPDPVDELVGDPRRLPSVVATSPRLDRFLRRWLRAATDETIDAMGVAEGALTVLDAALGWQSRPSRADHRLADAVRLALAETLGESVSLAELGRRVGSSPYHMARRFRASCGTSIHGWRTTVRVREALTRIDEGERDLTALALDLGFADHSHFTNTVRRVTGAPPSSMRVTATAAELAALRTILQAEAPTSG